MAESTNSTCERCGLSFEGSPYTAYLTGRGKETGLCKSCADQRMEEDCHEFADKIVGKIFDELNGGDKKLLAKAFANAIGYRHRYLQGEFFTFLFGLFQLYAKQDFDARNEWAVKIAGVWERCVGRFGKKGCSECRKVFDGVEG